MIMASAGDTGTSPHNDADAVKVATMWEQHDLLVHTLKVLHALDSVALRHSSKWHKSTSSIVGPSCQAYFAASLTRCHKQSSSVTMRAPSQQ
jgi:hypothetical protein